MRVAEYFQAIEQDRTVKGKLELMDEMFREHPGMTTLIRLSLDKLIKWGIKKVDPTDEATTLRSFEDCVLLLSALLLEASSDGAAITLPELKEHLESVRASLVEEDDVDVFDRIIAKDLRLGISGKTLNKHLGYRLVQEPPPYMRASTLSLSQEEVANAMGNRQWVLQEKYDGMFAYLVAPEYGNPYFLTRQGMEFDPNSLLMREFLSKPIGKGVLMGELLISDFWTGKPLDRKTGNGILNRMLNGTISDEEMKDYRLAYVVWDGVTNEEFEKGVSYRPYADRLLHICPLPEGVRSADTYHTSKSWQVISHMEDVIREGGEGVVLKRLDGLWKDGTSKEMFKIKKAYDVDLVVVGKTPGKGKNRGTFGSLVCQSKDGLLEVCVSGFTDEERTYYANRDFGYIITVKANELISDKKTGKYSLFLPRFVEERMDKAEADSLEEIKEVFK